MGSFSIWHWLVVLIMMVANVAMFLHIAVSSRTQGWAKAFWLLAAMMFPVIAYFIWLVARPSAMQANINKRVQQAEADALEAEARAREAEARARIARASSASHGG